MADCAKCGVDLTKAFSAWTIGDDEYCTDCGREFLEKESEIAWVRMEKEASKQAKEMARKLNRNVYVVEACPDRPLHTTFKRFAFLLEPSEAFGGIGFTPDGEQIECAHWT